MRVIEAKDLESNPGEILREVEEGQTIEVTRHGHAVARMVPVQREQPSQESIREALAKLDKLAEQIGAAWPVGVSAQDAIDDIRRDI
jgi:prevent-host-death family protein